MSTLGSMLLEQTRTAPRQAESELASLECVHHSNVFRDGFVSCLGMVHRVGAIINDEAEAHRTLTVDRSCHQTVVLIADSALGMVSEARLAVRPLTGFDTVVSLNRYHEREEVHGRSSDWLVEVDGPSGFTDVRQLSNALVPSKSRGARV